jgi:hypothetical protein
MGEFVRTDRRRIQTAVLGGADSDEPLMLPMEAIELDAFRRALSTLTRRQMIIEAICSLRL